VKTIAKKMDNKNKIFENMYITLALLQMLFRIVKKIYKNYHFALSLI